MYKILGKDINTIVYHCTSILWSLLQLPIETGRWNHTEMAQRVCSLCKVCGDELYMHMPADQSRWLKYFQWHKPNKKVSLSCLDAVVVENVGDSTFCLTHLCSTQYSCTDVICLFIQVLFNVCINDNNYNNYNNNNSKLLWSLPLDYPSAIGTFPILPKFASNFTLFEPNYDTSTWQPKL